MTTPIRTECKATWVWESRDWKNPEDVKWDNGYELESSIDGTWVPALTYTTLHERMTTPCLNVGNGVDYRVRVRDIDRDVQGTITGRGPISDWSSPMQFQYVPEPTFMLVMGVGILALWCLRRIKGKSNDGASENKS